MDALLFQYGRYLLIACSRPGSLPANLQGPVFQQTVADSAFDPIRHCEAFEELAKPFGSTGR